MKNNNNALLPVASPVQENMQRNTQFQQSVLARAAPDVAASTGAQCAVLNNDWESKTYGVFTTQTDAQGATVRMQSNPNMPTLSVNFSNLMELTIFDGIPQNGERMNAPALNY
jgi:hypothetical protein